MVTSTTSSLHRFQALRWGGSALFEFSRRHLETTTLSSRKWTKVFPSDAQDDAVLVCDCCSDGLSLGVNPEYRGATFGPLATYTESSFNSGRPRAIGSLSFSIDHGEPLAIAIVVEGDEISSENVACSESSVHGEGLSPASLLVSVLVEKSSTAVSTAELWSIAAEPETIISQLQCNTRSMFQYCKEKNAALLLWHSGTLSNKHPYTTTL